MEKLLNNFKIAFTKGDTYALAVKIKNITDDLNSAYFTVKKNPEDEPLIQKTLGAGVDKIDDRAYKNEKTYKIQLQSEDTANLEPLVQYLYDFRVAIGNVVKTLISGVFVLNHSISEVSTTITSTLEVAIEDTVESELSTTSPTSGIEYEQDPVALGKIGDMTTLGTTAKDTIVAAINDINNGVNEVKTPVFAETEERANINSGENQSTLFGKIKKWFSDLKALAFKDKVGTEDFSEDAICPKAATAETAETAGTATTATTATNANSANHALTADRSTNATNATNATYAKGADALFTISKDVSTWNADGIVRGLYVVTWSNDGTYEAEGRKTDLKRDMVFSIYKANEYKRLFSYKGTTSGNVTLVNYFEYKYDSVNGKWVFEVSDSFDSSMQIHEIRLITPYGVNV